MKHKAEIEAAMQEHCNWAIDVFTRAYQKLRSLPKDLQTDGIRNHATYYKHAAAAAKFMRSMIGKAKKPQEVESSGDISEP